MKILHIGDEIRHELGCAASLRMLGFDVTYVHLGSRCRNLSMGNVYLDEGKVELRIGELPKPVLSKVLFSSVENIVKILEREYFDVIITTPSVPFYIAHHIARKQKIPLILRVWGIRAAKLVDYIIFGRRYLEVFDFFASMFHNSMQAWNAQVLVAMDHVTREFLQKLLLFKNVYLIYPTYAALYDHRNDLTKEGENKIFDLIEKLMLEGGYVFSIVTLSRGGASSRLDQLLFKILLKTAIKNPDVNVVIVGSSVQDVMRYLNISVLPSNLYLVGKVFSDKILMMLYNNAKLIVIPVFFKSFSNRLLEAFFYGKPILTNSTAILLHKELKHLQHVYVSNKYDKYPDIIKNLLNNEDILNKLGKGAKDAFRSLFAARRCGIIMKKVIKNIVKG